MHLNLIIVYSLDTGIQHQLLGVNLDSQSVRGKTSTKRKSSKYIIVLMVSTFELLQAMSVRLVDCAPVTSNKRQVPKQY